VDRFPDAGAFAEALRVWRRNPDAGPAVAGVAATAAGGAATTPRGGEPTVYVPPRVTRPADRQPVAPAPRRPDAYRREREGQPWWMWLLALLAVILLGAIGFLAVQLFGGLGGPDESPSPTAELVTIPECEDVALPTLRSELSRLGLEVSPQEEEPSDDVEEGRVIRCDPLSGTEVEEGRSVTPIVSSGEESVEVPRLRGQTEAQAIQTLREEGLRVGEITRAPDQQIAAGSVVSSSPAAGVEVTPDSQVDLVVSEGPTPSPSPTPTPVPTPTPAPTPTPVPTLPATPAPTSG
jgi:hypothetical protein